MCCFVRPDIKQIVKISTKEKKKVKEQNFIPKLRNTTVLNTCTFEIKLIVTECVHISSPKFIYSHLVQMLNKNRALITNIKI